MTQNSWGRLPGDSGSFRVAHSENDIARVVGERATLIPYGLGRSYGDVCINPGGVQLGLSSFNRFIDFDTDLGLITVESGISLREIQRHLVPQGWALPVTPGTQFITVGGAIANDIHGKSHHVDGTFSHHVIRFSLLRSSGQILECSPTRNQRYFAATVGGLGLTGVILDVTIKLKRVPGPWIATETILFGSSDEFFAIADQTDKLWPNSVSWIDCTSRSGGKGVLMVGKPVADDRVGKYKEPIPFPVTPPFSLVNAVTLPLLNFGYYSMNRVLSKPKVVHYENFYYPLDGISNWNRAYGKAGFFQYQSVIPPKYAQDATREMLREIRKSGQGSFLAVLKKFGKKSSLGLLSFPMHGTTLALDFPNRRERTEQLFTRLDAIVREAGGRLYLAKDARMSRDLFEATYDNIDQFKKLRDPGFSSAMSRRLLGK